MFLALQLYVPLSSYRTSEMVSSPNPAMSPLSVLIEYFSVVLGPSVLMMSVVMPLLSVNVQNVLCNGNAVTSHRKTALLPSISNWSSGGPGSLGAPVRGEEFIALGHEGQCRGNPTY